MNSELFLISPVKLKPWYKKGYVVPFALRFKFQDDPWTIAKRVLANESNAFFLDSARFQRKTARYSYLGWKPFRIFRAKESNHILPKLRKLFKPYRGRRWPELPFFTGGAVGFFSYELAHAFETLPNHAEDDLHLDRAALLFVRDLIVFDHKEKICFLIANLIPAKDGSFENAFHRAFQFIQESRVLVQQTKTVPVPLRDRFLFKPMEANLSRPELVPKSKPVPARTGTGDMNGHFAIRNFQADISERAFKQMVLRVKKYIEAGDIYQANLSQRFSFEFKGNAETLYESLRRINPSPFSSFLKIGPLTVASVSPERLIKLDGDLCETRPIAGTRPRGETPAEEREFRRDLMMSPKERAEHIMLVDLERNDLGRVSEPKSVRVNELMTLEQYSHVVHIVSNISGRLRKGYDRFDLLKAVFPGGTITGCPKIRSMEIIEELEPFKRHLYTGSIGYLDFNGDMDLNIVIRSLILHRNKGYLQVGAGIVYDSDPESEYWETLHKGKALIDALCGAIIARSVATKQSLSSRLPRLASRSSQ